MKFKLAVASILGTMLGLQIYSARMETQTYDEAVHLTAGYSYWKTGEYRLNKEHPPLQKLLSAIPLLALQPEFPVNHETWKNNEQYEFARVFLYRGSIPADTLLFWGRGTGKHGRTHTARGSPHPAMLYRAGPRRE